MPQTILITGASSGIGRSTALWFAREGWNVVATMRDPDSAAELAVRPNVLVTALDVTDRGSIDAAVATAVSRFGKIDVLVNNAGFAVIGALEAAPMETIQRQFAVNVLGAISVTQAVLPHFRARAQGQVINISSIVGRFTYPLGSVYDATKFALDGFSEALRFELNAIGVRVKIIEPGLIATDFGSRSMEFLNDEALSEYQPVVQAMRQMAGRFAEMAEPPEVAAEAVWTAVHDPADTLRYPAGTAAIRALEAHASMDNETFYQETRARFGL